MFDLKTFLNDNNINQRELSKVIGYSEAYISRIIGGLSPMNDKLELKIKKAYPKLFDTSPKSEVRQVHDAEFMEIEYLPIEAQAGYLDSLDNQTLFEMKTILAPKEYEKGNYLIVEISGDSMNDGTARSIQHGDKLLCKELDRQHWRNKLHYNQYLFVIASMEGIVCKQIIEHDVINAVITCHSWNPLYRDYYVNLSAVYKLFYVKKIVERRIRF